MDNLSKRFLDFARNDRFGAATFCRDRIFFERYAPIMKIFPGFALASLILVTTVCAQKSADKTAAVLQAERDGCVAYRQGDADKIAKFLTDDYTLTNSKGEITTAADDLNDAKTGKVRYDVFENYDMKARVYGDHTAIVNGKTKDKGTAEGKPIDIIVQFTDTFVKQDGHWRLAAGHVSRLKE
jgi:ketosteroid isomerase-like protein